MANRKVQVSAIILFLVVFGGATVAFALTVFDKHKAAAPIVPTASTLPTPTYTNLNPIDASSPTVAPTGTPTSTPTSSPPPASTPAQVSAVNGSFELTVSLQKTVYSVGEPVNVTLSLTDISDQTVNVAVDAWLLDYTVGNGTSNLIYQHTDGGPMPMVVAVESFAPGHTITDTYSWLQKYSGPNPGPSVSPGTYYIVGKSATYGLETSPIQISIVNS